jgi:biopolymer transport protein ExbD
MKIDLESTEPDVRIEIVPLIDVIFCILTFFIVAAVTLTRQAAINVDLPKATSGTSQMRQILIVSVDPNGRTFLEKQPVSQEQLFQAITNFRKQNPEGMMVLYASRAASYNDVVQVLDVLRSAGGDRVALATLPGESAPNSPLPQSPSGGSLNSPGGLLPNSSPIPKPPASPNSLPNSLNPSSGDSLFPGVNPLPSAGKSSPNRTSPPPASNKPSSAAGQN